MIHERGYTLGMALVIRRLGRFGRAYAGGSTFGGDGPGKPECDGHAVVEQSRGDCQGDTEVDRITRQPMGIRHRA